MPDIREIMTRLSESKKARRELAKQIKTVFMQSKAWNDICETLSKTRGGKQMLEASMMQDMVEEQKMIERLTVSINDDQQILSDMALAMLTKGESLAIEGEDVRYTPKIKITFERQMKLL